MTAQTDPESITGELESISADGPAALAREVERLTRNAVTDRPKVELPGELADAEHVLAHVSRPGDSVRVEDLEHLLDSPARPRGTYTTYDAPSFVTLVGRLANVGNPDNRTANPAATLWAEQPSTGAGKPQITAVINDHDQDGHLWGWRDLRAVLEVRPDPDWLQWEARDAGAPGVRAADRWMDQVTFAEFVLDQTANIAGAHELYLAATTFESRRSMNVQSVINLDNGTQQYQYTEQLAGGREGAGTVELPNKLTVSLRPFYGAETVQLEVLLRHRLTEGKLRFGLFRVRPDLAVESAWAAWCDKVAAELPALPLLQGTPPAALK